MGTLLQDNMLVYPIPIVGEKAANFELLTPFPPYSPDLAPSDFFLFPKFKPLPHVVTI